MVIWLRLPNTELRVMRFAGAFVLGAMGEIARSFAMRASERGSGKKRLQGMLRAPLARVYGSKVPRGCQTYRTWNNNKWIAIARNCEETFCTKLRLTYYAGAPKHLSKTWWEGMVKRTLLSRPLLVYPSRQGNTMRTIANQGHNTMRVKHG